MTGTAETHADWHELHVRVAGECAFCRDNQPEPEPCHANEITCADCGLIVQVRP